MHVWMNKLFGFKKYFFFNKNRRNVYSMCIFSEMLFSKKWSEIKGKRSWKREGFDNGVKTGYFQLHAWRRLAKVVFTFFFSQEINKTGMHLNFKKLLRKNTKKTTHSCLIKFIGQISRCVCVYRLRNFGRTLVHVILDNFSEITWFSKYFWTHKLYWQKNSIYIVVVNGQTIIERLSH